MDDVEKYSRCGCLYQELNLGVYVSFELLIVRLIGWAVHLDCGADWPDSLHGSEVPMLPVGMLLFEALSLINFL